jgi:enoyl-CoA hydratase/carnithine racemase
MKSAREPASADGAFTVERREALEIVTLTRPATLNAISEDMAAFIEKRQPDYRGQ